MKLSSSKCLAVGLLHFSSIAFWMSAASGTRTVSHQFKMLTSQRVKSIMQCNTIDSLKEYDFPNILKERVPGTPGHAKVKEYILSRLSQLNCSRWNITEHSFEQDTIIGKKPFTNIVATLDPHVDRRLVLAAHYDSKMFSGGVFLGAIDSALPVALMLDMALALDSKLQDRHLEDISLQLIFIDGEEAFKRWTSTDSLYGSRRLAHDMAEEGGLLSVNGKTGVDAMEAFILLDLIGASQPSFKDYFTETSVLFQRIAKIEKRLKDSNYLESHSRNYFAAQSSSGYGIEDDHKPFQAKGVPIVHLIAYPFPSVWHTFQDNAKAIDWTFVSNFRKIMMVFLHEYFHLK